MKVFALINMINNEKVVNSQNIKKIIETQNRINKNITTFLNLKLLYLYTKSQNK